MPKVGKTGAGAHFRATAISREARRLPMKIIKRHKSKRRGAIGISVAQDIEQLKTHDWSDPLLDRYFAMVVEKLTDEKEAEHRCAPGEECPLGAGRGGD
jgi:hypothetical protein